MTDTARVGGAFAFRLHHLDPLVGIRASEAAFVSGRPRKNCCIGDVEPKGSSVLTEMKEPNDDTKEPAMNRKNYETPRRGGGTHPRQRPDATTLDRPRAPQRLPCRSATAPGRP